MANLIDKNRTALLVFDLHFHYSDARLRVLFFSVCYSFVVACLQHSSDFRKNLFICMFAIHRQKKWFTKINTTIHQKPHKARRGTEEQRRGCCGNINTTSAGRSGQLHEAPLNKVNIFDQPETTVSCKDKR